MLALLFLLAMIFDTGELSIATVKAKVGEPATLTLGGEIEEWQRILENGSAQRIKKCTGSMQPPACNTWLNIEGDVGGSGAIIKDNGDLYIESVKLEDAGFYESPQAKGTLKETPDGETYHIDAPVINLVVVQN
ncbi:hypothetical protein AB6A40_011112 [Gnathostoma spinigerum]|uniref:Uncharacterized protein n=1 Tax=Gnathostoma spinigerum TaxID=75299 RepID=A0ABD6F2Z3_9BILA